MARAPARARDCRETSVKGGGEGLDPEGRASAEDGAKVKGQMSLEALLGDDAVAEAETLLRSSSAPPAATPLPA